MKYERIKSDWPDIELDAQHDWFMARSIAPPECVRPAVKRLPASRITLKQKLEMLFAIVVIGTVLPVALLIVGFLGLALWDHLHGL